MLNKFWLWLEYLPISGEIGATWWFPLLESLHVLFITLMLGFILMVDLRLLGLAARRYSVLSISKELVPWSAAFFFLATVTGIGMFVTRASTHVLNPAFQIKMFLLLLAGINIALFHFYVARNISEWSASPQTPNFARFSAFASLGLWSGVMLSGRWVGHIV